MSPFQARAARGARRNAGSTSCRQNTLTPQQSGVTRWRCNGQMPQTLQKQCRAVCVRKRYSVSASAPLGSSKRLSCILTMSAFLRRQIEQSQVVSSGKPVPIAKRTEPQWQAPS